MPCSRVQVTPDMSVSAFLEATERLTQPLDAYFERVSGHFFSGYLTESRWLVGTREFEELADTFPVVATWEGACTPCIYLLRVAGSAKSGGTVESGQGYMQSVLWACLSV